MKFRDMREIRTTRLKDAVKYALVIERDILSALKEVAVEENTSVNEILRVLAVNFLASRSTDADAAAQKFEAQQKKSDFPHL
jgi:hypothetical protein